uniref:Uncharacterized protein n=1 Tax=Arundo donax TaxID=35708 RepID=A0A0A9BVA7_ARUDO
MLCFSHMSIYLQCNSSTFKL